MNPQTIVAVRSSSDEVVPCSMRDLLLYFLRLGTFGFGGPIALAGYMQRDLVEERRWFSRQDYLEGLALSQLSPGPLAAQLAKYLGWVRAGIPGATLVAAAFVAPSFVMVLAISWLYVRFGGLPWIQALDQRRHRRRLYCRWPLEQQTVGEHAIEPLTVAGEVGPNLEVRIERQHGDTIVRSQRLQKMSALQEQPHQADDA